MMIPKPSISWSPQATPVGYTVNGNTYPVTRQVDNISRPSDTRYAPVGTAIDTTITFTGTARTEAGSSAIEYKWIFSDGKIAFGPSVQRQFSLSHPEASVTLVVTDSKGRTGSKAQNINLQ